MDEGKVKIDIFDYMQKGFAELKAQFEKFDKSLEDLRKTLANGYARKEQLVQLEERLAIVEKTMITKESQEKSFMGQVQKRIIDQLISATANFIFILIGLAILFSTFRDQLLKAIGL